MAELRSIQQPQTTSSGVDYVGVTVSASDHARDAVDLELPLGLANLRNTCYLNSILQYFYSVNAVRDLVLNTDFPGLDPTEENLRNLLRTDSSSNISHDQKLTDLETGRAFVGHECKAKSSRRIAVARR